MRVVIMLIFMFILAMPLLADDGEGGSESLEKIIVAGIVGLVLNGMGLWMREVKKHKEWKKKNGHIEEIKKTVGNIDTKMDDIDKNLTEVTTEVKGMKSNCRQTVTRFEKGLETHSQQILDMAKNNRKKS